MAFALLQQARRAPSLGQGQVHFFVVDPATVRRQKLTTSGLLFVHADAR
jgi:hypothetical protein